MNPQGITPALDHSGQAGGGSRSLEREARQQQSSEVCSLRGRRAQQHTVDWRGHWRKRQLER